MSNLITGVVCPGLQQALTRPAVMMCASAGCCRAAAAVQTAQEHAAGGAALRTPRCSLLENEASGRRSALSAVAGFLIDFRDAIRP